MTSYPGSDGNGLTMAEIFQLRLVGRSTTYEEFIMLPRYVEAPPRQETVDLRVDLAPGFSCLPLISSPMDTVTEELMAIQMARNGCLGVLHNNLTVDEAVRQVRRVKRDQIGFNWDPVCLPRTATVSDVLDAMANCGFSTFPITEGENGKGKFLGLVTRTNIDLEPEHTRSVLEVMTPVDRLLTRRQREVSTLEEARETFRANPTATKLPVLNDDGSLFALINRKNLKASDRYPHPLVDANKQLRVAAAVTTHWDDDERAPRLIEAGVDAIVIDSSQGATGYALKRIAQIRALRPDLPIIAGNVVTPAQAKPLIEAGANILRVGMGSGSICITQGQYGLGRGQATAVFYCRGGIADGGIRTSGDMVTAFALGARGVMLGRYLAGCDEAAGELIEYRGRRFRRYRGMGSVGAMKARGATRYGGNAGNAGNAAARVVAQGVEDAEPTIGPVDDRLAEALAGVRGAIAQAGCSSLAEFQSAIEAGEIRFEIRSPPAIEQGKAHVSEASKQA